MRRPRRARRGGISLGNTLVVVSVASTLAFTVAAASLTHLNFSTGVSNGVQAQNVAESTLATAIARLLDVDQQKLGENRQPESALVLAINGGEGRLCFNADQSRLWKIPYSTNNFAGENSVEGYDPRRPIPKNSAQLVAQGRFNGVMRQVEAVLYIPPFPYAVASAGPFSSLGQLEVGSVDKVLLPGEQPAPEDILSANLASNAGGIKSLVLGPDSRISGDVRTAGVPDIDKSVYIGGQLRSGASPIQIPKEEVTSYDPEMLGKPNLQFIPEGNSQAPAIQGFAKSRGTLKVSGGLQLDNGVLYVDGDLNVEGGIRGKGAIFVTKNLNLSGPTRMETDNQVAVLAGGNVTIAGSGSQSSLFQGMIYNEGAFKADRITLMGVFIQNDKNSPVEVSNAKMLYSPEQGRLEMNVVGEGKVNRSAGNVKITGLLGLGGTSTYEVYPVKPPKGGYELVDPFGKKVYWFATVEEVKTNLGRIWKEAGYPTDDGRGLLGGGGLLGLGGVVNPLSSALGTISTQVEAAAKESPRESGDSRMLSMVSYVVDPSRFLSLKDRVRLLYWRAR